MRCAACAALGAEGAIRYTRTPMHPAVIGPFKIERELGRGGMGEVYLARDTQLDRPVAIKALPVHLAQDPDR
jgi:serine/threonine protein kinase